MVCVCVGGMLCVADLGFGCNVFRCLYQFNSIKSLSTLKALDWL